MAWKYNDKYIRAGRSWVGTATDEEGNTFDVTHPRNWVIGQTKTKPPLVLYGKMTQHRLTIASGGMQIHQRNLVTHCG